MVNWLMKKLPRSLTVTVCRCDAGFQGVIMKKIILFFLLFSGALLFAQADFSGKIKWIWTGKGFKNNSYGYFRKTFILPDEVKEAQLLICSDDSCRLLAVNGVSAPRMADPVQQGAPIRIHRYDVKKLLRKGSNVLALCIFNNISAAGVILSLEIDLKNGEKVIVKSDKSFLASEEGGDGFSQNGFDDSAWHSAAELGDASYPVWKKITRAEEFFFSDAEKAIRENLKNNAVNYIRKLNYAIPGDGFGKCKWIWYPEISVAVEKTPRYFAREFEVSELPSDAEIMIMADDACEIVLNGKPVSAAKTVVQSEKALKAKCFDLTGLIRNGRNRIQIKVYNPAGDGGLIAELRMNYPGRGEVKIVTDSSWKSARQPDAQWFDVWVMGDARCWPWQDISTAAEVFLTPEEKAIYEAWDHTVENIDDILQLNNEADTTAKVVTNGNQTALEINGKIVSPILYIVWLNGRMRGMLPARSSGNVTKMHQEGINLIQYPIPLRDYMSGKDKWNQDYIRRNSSAIKKILAANPDARLILAISMEAPLWYMKANMDECVGYVTGPGQPGIDTIRQVLAVSMASDKWRKDAAAAVEKMLGELKKESWFKRVAGFRIGYGVYSEWHYYGMSRHMPDTGKRMTEKFRQYLAGRYGSDAALQKAWNKADVKITAAEVPGRKERGGKDRFIRDFVDPDDRQTMDYYDCQQKVTADLLLAWAKEFKRIAPGKLVGAWYGYVFEMAYPADGQTVEYERVLSSPYIDFLSSPYGYGSKNRHPGGSGHPRIISSPFVRYGKLAFFEDDSRTHLAGAPHKLDAASPRQSESILKRNFSVCLIEHIGLQFNDLGNHWNIPGVFTDPLQLAVINRVNRIWKKLYSENRPAGCADIAAVYDPREMVRHNRIMHPVFMIDALSDESLHAMRQAGRPISVMTLEDYLKNSNRFKMVVMLNCFSPSDIERRQILNKIRRDGSHPVWIYAPGIATVGGLSDKAMSDFTGIKLSARYEKLPLAVRMSDGSTMTYSRKMVLKENPRISVVDTGVTVLGRYENDNSAAVVCKKDGDRYSFFSGSPITDGRVWKMIYDLAGIHRYTEPGVVVYTNGTLLMVHTGRAGKFTVNLPEKRQVTELFSSKVISTATDSFELSSDDTETWLFELK